jgi:hypothetical protein
MRGCSQASVNDRSLGYWQGPTAQTVAETLEAEEGAPAASINREMLASWVLDRPQHLRQIIKPHSTSGDDLARDGLLGGISHLLSAPAVSAVRSWCCRTRHMLELHGLTRASRNWSCVPPACWPQVLGGVLANSVVRSIGRGGQAPIKNWFFYSLFAGGSGLEEDISGPKI